MRRLLLAAALLLAPALALAQTSNGRVATSAPTYTNGTTAPFSLDTSGRLRVNCLSGCSAGSFNTNADAVAAAADNSKVASFLYGYNGATWDRLQVDASKNLKVNCASGCSGGTFNNNADAVATSATNGQSAAWLYGWNGTTWDRLRVDGSKNLLVGVATALPAGTNVIGHVINDTGSTTAVTGNVTVVQGTGTNLHAVIDSGSTTAVTQATASNLNATVVGTGTFANQPAGSVAHDGAAAAVNPVLTGCYASAAAPTDVSADADSTREWCLRNGARAVQQTYAGVLGATGNGVSGTGVPRVTIASDSTGVVGLNAGTNTVGGAFPSASATIGGTTLYTLTAANSTNAANVKASAGQVYGLSGYTISATPAWLSLYNTAGTPTCGTSIIQQYLIPGSTSGAGFNIAFPVPKQFATGIGICLTTGIAGTGAVAASSYVIDIDYK